MPGTICEVDGGYDPSPSHWTEPPPPAWKPPPPAPPPPGPIADPQVFCPPVTDQPVCTAPAPFEDGDWVDPNGQSVAPELPPEPPAPKPEPLVIDPYPTVPCPPGKTWGRTGRETSWKCVPDIDSDPTVGMPTTTPEEDEESARRAECMEEFKKGGMTVSNYRNCVEGMGEGPEGDRDPNWWEPPPVVVD